MMVAVHDAVVAHEGDALQPLEHGILQQRSLQMRLRCPHTAAGQGESGTSQGGVVFPHRNRGSEQGYERQPFGRCVEHVNPVLGTPRRQSAPDSAACCLYDNAWVAKSVPRERATAGG